MTEEQIMRSPAGDLVNVLSSLPSIRLRGDSIRIKGATTNPMVLIDGQKMIHAEDGDWAVFSLLGDLRKEDVAQIDIITGFLRMYGSGAEGGVIEIFTKKGYWNIRKPRFNTEQTTPLGYQTPVEFYSPKYDTREAKNNTIPDLRSTIHWQPNVLSDSEGKAKIEFYTSDTKTTYSIIIEGVTPEGKLIYQRKNSVIEVK